MRILPAVPLPIKGSVAPAASTTDMTGLYDPIPARLVGLHSTVTEAIRYVYQTNESYSNWSVDEP